MWIHSTPRIHIPAVEAIFTGRDIILFFFFFYGLTHLSAVTLNHSVLCPVKFYCTWKCWLIVKPVILSHAMTQQQFHLKRVQFFFVFFFGQCFKDHLLKWTFLFKLDSFFNQLKDKHHQGEVKRRLRGLRFRTGRKLKGNACALILQKGNKLSGKIWNNILANGKGLELPNGWWKQFHKIRQKLLLSKANKCTHCLSGGKWGWQADLSRQPLSAARVSFTPEMTSLRQPEAAHNDTLSPSNTLPLTPLYSLYAPCHLQAFQGWFLSGCRRC